MSNERVFMIDIESLQQIQSLSLTQWASFILALIMMFLAIYFRNKEYFQLVWPVLFLMGLHVVVFYFIAEIYVYCGYDLGSNLYPFPNFSFRDWSAVLRLHTQTSIIIIIVTRYIESRQRNEKYEETLKILKRNGGGTT